MLYKNFYSELGKLLYAVADIDGVISQKEKKTIHELVLKELVPNTPGKDQFGTHHAYYAEFEFDIMDEAVGSPEDAFNSFIDFVEDHKTAFTGQLKKTTIKVANELAKAYHGKSKKEKELIEQLKKKLRQIN